MRLDARKPVLNRRIATTEGGLTLIKSDLKTREIIRGIVNKF